MSFDTASRIQLSSSTNFAIVYATQPPSVQVWNLKTQTKVMEIPNPSTGEIFDVSLSPDDQKLAVSQSASQCSTKIISFATGSELSKLQFVEPATLSGTLSFQASWISPLQYGITGTGTIEGIGSVSIEGTGYSLSNEVWTRSGSGFPSFNADLKIIDTNGSVRFVAYPLPPMLAYGQPPVNSRSSSPISGTIISALGQSYDITLQPTP